jgi:hypothetical protein
MRKLYTYEVIRYYPNIRGDEFFNIGIRLSDSTKNTKIKFIQDEHLSYIHRFPSIEKRVINSMIEQLKESESSLKTWYANYLKIGQENIYRSDESFETIMDFLYEDFIGYKFHKKEKIDNLQKIKRETEKLLSTEFKNYLKIEKDTIFDFAVFDKNDIKHLCELGSITNKLHVNKMIWQREESLIDIQQQNTSFDFLNISKDNAIVAENLLNKNEVDIVSYSEDDSRYEYFKRMIA